MKTGLGRAVTDSKLFGPHMLEDPYPVYRKLQAETPVYWDEGLNAWIVTRHEDVAAVLKDARFSSERVRPVVEARFPDPALAPLFDTLALTMVNRDDPDHARLRKLVHHAFQRTEVERWEPRIRAIVDGLIGEAMARGEIDFVWDFAVPLPVMVISEIVGIPFDDRPQVKSWCDDFAQVALNFYANISPEQLRQGLEGVTAFRAYLEAKADAHHSGTVDPAEKDTLFANLVHAEVDDHRLSLDELLANTLLLLSAGNETTTSLLANGLLALLKHPDQLARLRAEPERIPDAIDEILRWDPPVQFLGRLASEDIELGGHTIRRGDLTVVVMAAANRDPAVFEEPDRLDVTRQAHHAGHAHHVSFGHGRHLCSGMQLALMEARIAFETLLARVGTIELLPGAVLHRENFNMRCPQHLPVRLTAA